MKDAGKGPGPAEGVTLSGEKDCRRIALRRSPLPFLREAKGCRRCKALFRANLSGKRTEVLALNGFVSYTEFLCVQKFRFFHLAKKRRRKYAKLFQRSDQPQ